MYWEVLNGVGVDGAGVNFPPFYRFLRFSVVFALLVFFLGFGRMVFSAHFEAAVVIFTRDLAFLKFGSRSFFASNSFPCQKQASLPRIAVRSCNLVGPLQRMFFAFGCCGNGPLSLTRNQANHLFKQTKQ